MSSTRNVLVLLAALWALPACASASVDVGYQTPANGHPGEDQWVLEGRVNTGEIVKLGLAARTKLGDAHDQLALAPELSIEMSPGPVTLGARLGMSLLQLDSANGHWTVGAGSPYLQPLVQVRIGDPVWLFVGGTLEYEIRSGDGPDLLYLGAQVGLGIDL